ncbi:MAG: hypothetical protein ACOCQ5_05400 [Halanaerobiales bacterium]
MRDQYSRIYLEQNLQWIKKRKNALNIMEDKLKQMKQLAEYISDNDPAPGEHILLDQTFQKLKADVESLDTYSRNKDNTYQNKNKPGIIKRLDRKI